MRDRGIWAQTGLLLLRGRRVHWGWVSQDGDIKQGEKGVTDGGETLPLERRKSICMD